MSVRYRAWSGVKMWEPFDLHTALTEGDGCWERDCVFLLSTDRFDINGVEIFQADIVKATHKGTGYVYQGVVNNHGVFGMRIENGTSFIEFDNPYFRYERIGNRFQNPDLL